MEKHSATRRNAAIEELAQIGESQTPQDPELLDFLPVGEIMPPSRPTPELYRLFESLRLQLHYEHGTHRVRCRVALRSESIDEILSASADVVRSVVDVFCAPGRNRQTSTTSELVLEGVFEVGREIATQTLR